LEAGREFGIEPCGLGARDTLRLEAGMCLYGNDIDESTTPFEATIGFVVKLEKGQFIGKDALANEKAVGIRRKRVGISMLDKGIPRQHFEVLKDQVKIGSITSGTFSPLLDRGIAMAYITLDSANVGQRVNVKIRQRLAGGEIVKFPFYDSTRYGYGRKT
jgi:aminomethyltransferase